MWLHPRVEIQGPQWRAGDFRDVWHRVWAGHSGDEYGNCSFFLITALLGGIVIFPGLHFQRDIELPEPGEHPWTDRRYYPDL